MISKEGNTVEWKNVFFEDDRSFISLLEFFEDNTLRFLASINTKKNSDGLYEFCAFSKDRVLQTVLSEQYPDSIEEAKRAIEEYLTEEGIL